jgi:hypothetical protein
MPPGRIASRFASVVAGVGLLGLAACQPPPTVVEAAPAAAAVVVTTTERTIVLTVNFEFDSYQLRPDAILLLNNVASAMLDPAMAGARYDINGHTDVSGQLGYNISLSNLRAQAVISFLASRGVPIANMRPQGFGPLQLLDPAHPFSPVNRRVEIVRLP